MCEADCIQCEQCDKFRNGCQGQRGSFDRGLCPEQETIKILQMEPGRELDKLVAEKIIGFVSLTTSYNQLDGNYGALPHYSTEILAASEVRSWLLENIGGVSLLCYCDEQPERCKIHRVHEGDVEVLSESMPESICKAALLAVMEV